jgi:hypothetical protein
MEERFPKPVIVETMTVHKKTGVIFVWLWVGSNKAAPQGYSNVLFESTMSFHCTVQYKKSTIVFQVGSSHD